jgi:hypothetical protein
MNRTKKIDPASLVGVKTQGAKLVLVELLLMAERDQRRSKGKLRHNKVGTIFADDLLEPDEPRLRVMNTEGCDNCIKKKFCTITTIRTNLSSLFLNQGIIILSLLYQCYSIEVDTFHTGRLWGIDEISLSQFSKAVIGQGNCFV